MKTYQINVTRKLGYCDTVDVNAETEDDAKDRAIQKFKRKNTGDYIPGSWVEYETNIINGCDISECLNEACIEVKELRYKNAIMWLAIVSLVSALIGYTFIYLAH